MIRNANEISSRPIEIDLTGLDGNAFVLLGYAQRLSRKLGLNTSEITSRMVSSNYENLVEVFDEYFGDYVILYR